MPLISELHEFPFISDDATAGAGNDPYEVLKEMVASKTPFVFPKEGSYWFCAGMTISAFEVRLQIFPTLFDTLGSSNKSLHRSSLSPQFS